MATMSGYGSISDKNVLGSDSSSAEVMYRWSPYKNTPGAYLREFLIKDLVCVSPDGSSSFILSGKASPRYFREYDGEFDSFFKAFIENAQLQ